MIYLLDTYTFIWAVLSPGNLSKHCKKIIVDKNNEICVSTVSLWEMSLKTQLKKFAFEGINIEDFPQYARDMEFSIIDMQEKEAVQCHALPLKENHQDPFERMLIWQAVSRGMIMISKNKLFAQYKKDGLKLIW
jgi:PIN domain nuclease of toxin-antitoxin system